MPDPNGNGNGNGSGSDEDPSIEVYEPIPGTNAIVAFPANNQSPFSLDRTEAPLEIQSIYPSDDEELPPENSN
jgi:hypothetical protein